MQQLLTTEKLELDNVGHFCLKKSHNDLLFFIIIIVSALSF